MSQGLCSVEGCDKSLHCRELCQMHYRRWRKYGDVDTVKKKQGSGRSTHQKLSEAEREARAHERQALKEAKTHCVHGHALTPENTYVTKKGQRVCRICQRQAQQKHFGRTVTHQPMHPRGSHACPNGHLYTEHGTTNSAGVRVCKACKIDRRRESVYGLSPDEYEKMLKAQNGKCAICPTVFRDPRERHIDHCHETGRVRGLLCGRCNNGLGRFRDDPDLLRAAASYIETGATARAQNKE